ncbi:MAG: small ribosomal subunit Rsm22 family protein [Verrucomicrobiota bacterium]|nr:small ribosomal subunit Rsm22 family protein [Verrucomicrobiota bacterium]
MDNPQIQKAVINPDGRQYPLWAESWWVQEFLGGHKEVYRRGYDFAPPGSEAGVTPEKLSEGRSLTQLRERVDGLSDLFTKERVEGFGQYARDRKLLQAYGLFYFPQTFIRTRMVLSEIVKSGKWVAPTEKISILDCGAGTGAAGLSAADFLNQTGARDIFLHAIDDSIQSMKLIQEFVSGTRKDWRGPSVKTTVADLSLPEQFARHGRRKYDVVIASFVMNEIYQGGEPQKALEWCRNLLRLVSPNGVLLLMEPALKESAERIEWIRDQFALEGVGILGPCLHRDKCPLLSEGKYHCHEVRTWKPPESLQLINRKLKRSVEQTLKFSFLALQPGQIAREKGGFEHSFRMISPWARGKGKWFTTGCNDQGVKAIYEIQSRDLPEKPEKQFARIERGDIVCLTAEGVERKGDIYRIENIEAMKIIKP